ncbi:IS5 family transposase [Streptomyces sp. BR123]|uniref:IS5 family transposase n=1 Tax=Streptomyces sp. BR123 TaxID=2749828 RepID=UPI0015C458B2|nr:IS5 family transposase [Streptomyces sp. BR123]NXY94168.1 IS5 family transposase [Streptomyces sp. BR123]
MSFDAAHRWFTKWRRDGTWDRIHCLLRPAVRCPASNPCASPPSLLLIDWASITAADGSGSGPACSRTRRRNASVIVDTMELPLVVAVTSASVQYRAGGRAVLARPAEGFRTVSPVSADGGYANSVGSRLLSCARDRLNIVVEIVKRTDDVKGFKVLPSRWIVERMLGRLVRNRRLARDYERLTATSEAMVKVAMIRMMLVRPAGQSSRWSHDDSRKTVSSMTVEDLVAA